MKKRGRAAWKRRGQEEEFWNKGSGRDSCWVLQFQPGCLLTRKQSKTTFQGKHHQATNNLVLASSIPFPFAEALPFVILSRFFPVSFLSSQYPSPKSISLSEGIMERKAGLASFLPFTKK